MARADVEVGQTVSHFQVVERLGAGGMGVVYKAVDSRLGRAVALKFLNPEASGDAGSLERFDQEARAASALSHPNICSIYEIDEHHGLPFIAMELLEGESLKERIEHGPLPLEQVLDLAIQISKGLEVAHESGLVHRDVKPANLYVTTHGHLKILDFGLAKLVASHGSGVNGFSEQPTAFKTDPGVAVGTVAYMSPEQARGEELDERTDIFSLGSVIYEMVTGRPAFAGATKAVTFDSILHGKPVSPVRLRREVPDELEHIIDKTLEKDRRLRYQHVAELHADLARLERDSDSGRAVVGATARGGARSRQIRRAGIAFGVGAIAIAVSLGAWWWMGARTPSVHARSVAVLPFHNQVADATIDYLSLAVADEIATALSSAPTLEVRPLAMTRRFVAEDLDPLDAAREVRAASVITGHFAPEGDQLAVTMEALEVDTERVLWRERLTVPPGDMISLREKLAMRIHNRILPALGVAVPQGLVALPRNAEAYELFLRSLAVSSDPGPNAAAIEMLEQSVALDPEFASGWSELSRRHYYDATLGAGGELAVELSMTTARRALELDPNALDAAQRLIAFQAEAGQTVEAYRAARVAVSRHADRSEIRFTMGYVYRYAGLLREAARECERALTISPTSPTLRSCSVAHYRLGRYTRARHFLELDEGSLYEVIHGGLLLLHEGRVEDARQVWRQLPQNSVYWGVVDHCLDRAGTEETTRLLRNVERVGRAARDPEIRYYMSVLLSTCGETGTAAEVLEMAIDGGYCVVSAFELEHPFEKLRAHPAWSRLESRARQCRDRFVEETGLAPALQPG